MAKSELLGKIPPQNIEAEAAVLGAILVNKEAMDKVADVITDQDFYRQDHQIIYRAILRLFDKRSPIDLVTLTNELEALKQLDQVGGAARLAELVNAVPTALHVTHYAEIVRQKAVLRRILQAGQKISQLGYEEDREVQEILDEAEKAVFEVSHQLVKDNFLPIADILAASFDRIDRLHREKGILRGTTTGFKELDNKLSGLQPSDLIILAARPSMGKCLAGNTQILNPETGELRTIQELVANRTGKVASLNHKKQWKKIKPSNFINDGYKPTFKVITASGREIEATLPHPFLTVSGWRHLVELAVGDKIAVAKSLPFFGKTSWSVSKVENLVNIITTYDPGANLRPNWPPETAREQNTSSNSETSYSVETKLKSQTTDQKLPEIILQFNKKTLSVFLNRLFGSYARVSLLTNYQEKLPVIYYTGVSKPVVSRIQHLLTRFGITSKVRSVKDSDLFELEISDKKALLNFDREIGISGLKQHLNYKLPESLDESVTWDRIISIKPGTIQPVYDLTVPDEHNFVANDFVVHNTTLALNMALNAAVKGKTATGFFSLEQSKEQIVDRLICAQAMVDGWKLRTGNLSEDDFPAIGMAMGTLAEAPLFIDDSPGLSVLEIRTRARRLKAEHNLGMLVIDYLQLIDGPSGSNSDNRVQQVSDISRNLKAIARELDIPVVALSQLSRAVESRDKKIPQLSDLRESGCLSGRTKIIKADNGQIFTMEELAKRSIQEPLPVLSMNENQQLVVKYMTKAFSSGVKSIYLLTMKTGSQIEASANHPFYRAGEWVRLDRLKVGDKIARVKDAKSKEIEWDEVVSINLIGEEEVFDATVPETHNFVANDIIVHNSIEQDADVVMFMYREDYYDRETERKNITDVLIRKHRNGPIGEVELHFRAEQSRFFDVERKTKARSLEE